MTRTTANLAKASTPATPLTSTLSRAGLAAFSLAALASVACAPMSEEDAAATWASVGDSFNSGDGSSAEQALSVDVSASATFDCRRDGDMDVTSNLSADAGDGDLSVAFDYDVEYDACQPDEDTLDGSLSYRAAFESERTEDGRDNSLVYTYDGLILVTDEDGNTQECVIDAQGFASSSFTSTFSDGEQEAGAEFRAAREIRYEGTICGHDANKVAQASVSITVD